MDRALLHASISTSVQVADLSILGQLIFERMFPHADSQGRLPGHPRKVKATVIPMVDASAEQVAEQLQKMHDLGLIIWYEADGEKYVQLVSWWRYQDRRFARPSKYPAPEGWKDRIRYNDPHEPKRLILENWEGVFGEPRIGKCKGDPAPKPPIHDSYVGNLYRPPTQEAQNDPSSSASPLIDQNLLPEPAVSDGSNGDARKPSHSRKRISYPDAFTEFWNAYSRPIGKMAAYEAWVKITTDGYTPEDILRATEEYSRQMKREKREESKIRYPERFLKKDFWKDFCFEEESCSQS